MKITYAPRGILQIDDAQIKFPNFEGRASKYNREGDRDFLLVIESPEDADRLVNLGWNVKIKDARVEGERPYMQMKVKVKYNKNPKTGVTRGPSAYLVNGRGRPVELTDETIGILDHIDILSVDMDICPHDWERDGETGRTAYLQSIHVTQRADRFAARYSDDKE